MLRPIQAYMDESGIHEGAAAVTLAGFVGGARAWVQFDRLWRAELRRQGLTSFHARKFFQQHDQEKHAEKLLNIAAGLRLYPVGGVVPAKDFEQLSDQGRRILTGAPPDVNGTWNGRGKPSAPYFLIFPFAFVQAERVVTGSNPIHYVFDSQREYEGYALNWFNILRATDGGERLGSIEYRQKGDTPGLQLADFLAYVLYQKYQPGGFADPLRKYCFLRLSERDATLPAGKRNLTEFTLSDMENVILRFKNLRKKTH